MENKKLATLLVALIVLIILIFLIIRFLFLPCDYIDYDTFEKWTCDCSGIEVDMGNDFLGSGVFTKCIGIVKNCELVCSQDDDCGRYSKGCNCDYETKEICESNGGEWQTFMTCMVIGCPPAPDPCCKCSVKCVEERCVIG